MHEKVLVIKLKFQTTQTETFHMPATAAAVKCDYDKTTVTHSVARELRVVLRCSTKPIHPMLSLLSITC